MPIGEIARRYTHERHRTAGPEMDTDDRGVITGVDDEVAPIGPGYHGAGISLPGDAAWVLNVQRVVPQVDHQFQRAARDDSFSWVRWRIAQQPEVRHVVRERWAWTIRQVLHSPRMPTQPKPTRSSQKSRSSASPVTSRPPESTGMRRYIVSSRSVTGPRIPTAVDSSDRRQAITSPGEVQ